MLADAFERMRQDAGEGAGNGDLLEQLVHTLLGEADMPPKEVKGVSDEFLAGMNPKDVICLGGGRLSGSIVACSFEQYFTRCWYLLSMLILSVCIELERVPKKALKKDMSCPICNNPFLDGMSRALS